MSPGEPPVTADMLPTPTGPHPVGRVSYDWVDPGRADVYSGDPGDRRELVVFLWYPAAPPAGAEFAPYLPAGWAPTAQFLGLDVADRRSHAVADAAVADAGQAYPVLLLSPSGFPPLMLAAIAEELASHGYVVVGVNHTYETTVTVFHDGRVVPMNPAAIAGALGPQTGAHEEVFGKRRALSDYKAADLVSVADHLERLDAAPDGPFSGRLDLGRLGALGHSFGGNAALELCRTDPRCRAAVNLDGALWTEVGRVGLPRPAMQILAGHPEFAVPAPDAVKAGAAPNEEWFEAEKALTLGGWRTVHAHARPGYTVQIPGATHLSFMDVPFLPVQEGSMVTAMLARTSIAPDRMWRITSDALLAFFARHLGGADATLPEGTGAPLLDGAPDNYPEATFTPP